MDIQAKRIEGLRSLTYNLRQGRAVLLEEYFHRHHRDEGCKQMLLDMDAIHDRAEAMLKELEQAGEAAVR